MTVLRTDQYSGLESFREVGEFVPLRVDRRGKVIREVALARFSLPLPEHPGQALDLRVALIRDLRRHVPDEQRAEEDEPLRWDEKPDGTHEHWLDASWQATPLPAKLTAPKLIPIVTTAPEADAVELVQTYMRRWPAQENIIRDCAPFRREIGYLPKAGEVESETSRTTPDLTRKLGKGQ